MASRQAVGSTMVEVSDEDLCLVLARAIASADPSKQGFDKKCEDLASQEKNLELITALVGAAGGYVGKASAGDAESGLSILAHTIAKLPQENCDDLASKFVSATTSASTSGSAEDLADLTIAILMRAYNAFPAKSKARFNTLISTLTYAAGAKKTDGLTSVLKGKTEVLKKEFSLEGDSFRTLLFALSNVFTKAGKESFSILTEYLTSFSPANTIKGDKNAAVVAKRAIKELISTPELVKCDFYETVQHLSGDKAFDLMKIVLESNVAKVKAFCGSNAGVLSGLGVTAEQCIDKVRLMALATMGAEAQTKNGEISYSGVKSSLDISEEDVELWLIKAIGLKVLEGRMDQFNQLFKVQKTAYKSFGASEWNTLNEKLVTIHANVANVQTKLKTRK